MSHMNNLALEIDEAHPEWSDEKKLLYGEVYLALRYGRDPELSPDIRRFFQSILPDGKDGCYWTMVSDNQESVNISCETVENLLRVAARLSREHYNFYFSPAFYDGWRTDNETLSVSSLFIDIDDVEGTDFSAMETGEIIQWLTDTYSLPREYLPCWIVSSGHGLHLYYRTSEISLRCPEQRKLRALYTDYLIRFFQADKACRNISRVLRVPGSYNIKHAEVKTRLHAITPDRVYTLPELDFFAAAPEEIEAYMQQNQEAKNAKSRATREKNREKREADKAARKAIREAYGTSSGPKKKKSQKKLQAYSRQDSRSRRNQLQNRNVSYIWNFNKHDRYWNLIKDLNNYYCRHGGNIEGHRNQFVHLMANCLKHAVLKETAVEYILRYVDEDFREEAIRTIEAAYRSQRQYRYRNVTIAEMLGFTEADIKASYCNFSEKRAAQAKARSLKREHQKESEKRKVQRNTAGRRKELEEKVRTSPLPVRELADALGVSESTVKRIRRKLREEGRL